MHKYKIEISNMNENYQFIKFKIKNCLEYGSHSKQFF